MARKKKAPPSGPSNAYLMSFGDTMTTLLAFFIVLNSLAEDQTGANLHRGSGSFVRTMEAWGMPGNLPGDRQRTAVDMGETNPLYVVGVDEDVEPDSQAKGPDETDDGMRVIDREREDFERFVDDLAELTEISETPGVNGEVVFDYFDKLNEEPPLLNHAYRRAMSEVIPRLYELNYRVEIIVWSPTPAATAWERSARLADQVGQEIVALGNLNELQKKRLMTTSKPWIDSKAKRPILSVVIRKT